MLKNKFRYLGDWNFCVKLIFNIAVFLCFWKCNILKCNCNSVCISVHLLKLNLFFITCFVFAVDFLFWKKKSFNLNLESEISYRFLEAERFRKASWKKERREEIETEFELWNRSLRPCCFEFRDREKACLSLSFSLCLFSNMIVVYFDFEISNCEFDFKRAEYYIVPKFLGAKLPI